MSDVITPLILDFVEWVAREPRAYADAMEAWRTSCPKLTVWEDAFDQGLVFRSADANRSEIRVTAAGIGFLKAHERMIPHRDEQQELPAKR